MKIKVLSRQDLIQILELPKVIEGVEAVYKAKAQGDVVAWPLVEHKFEDGSLMDIRSGGVFGEVGVHGAKLLNNFPANAAKGLPVFTGVLMSFDSSTGLPTGVMDASYITSLRTGSAAAIGAAAQLTIAVLPDEVPDVLAASARGDLRLVIPADDVTTEADGEVLPPEEIA